MSVGSRRFRDEPVWDANDPVNIPETYASVVSQALGLNWDAAHSIRQAVQEQLRTAVQVQWRLPLDTSNCRCNLSLN